MKRTALSLILVLTLYAISHAAGLPPAPSLNTNPSMDVIVTRTAPLLSFKKNTEAEFFEIELDLDQSFHSASLRRYKLNPGSDPVSALQISENNPLQDKSLWWWRVRSVDSGGTKSPWAISRFYVDTESDDAYSGLQRVEPVSVKAGSGSNPEFLIDYSDAGLNSQWRAAPPGSGSEWIELDLGKPVTISRIWMLAQFENSDGWPRNFHWLASNDGARWKEVNGAKVENSDTYRIIRDIPEHRARFWRMVITDYQGYAPALNEVMLFSPGQPEIPDVPDVPYVLVIGNQHNGFTFTRLAQRVRELKPELRVLRIPYWKANLKMYRELPHKPVAIILSGNNADYNNLPMFEYNGEYELLRQADVPMLGICAGCQMNAFCDGYTRVHSMGWSDISAMQTPQQRTKIIKLINDPLFQKTPEPFIAPEVHGWAIYSLPQNYEIIAASGYIQAVRRKDLMRYGVQFHPEIEVSYNQAVSVLNSFLNSALERAQAN